MDRVSITFDPGLDEHAASRCALEWSLHISLQGKIYNFRELLRKWGYDDWHKKTLKLPLIR